MWVQSNHMSSEKQGSTDQKGLPETQEHERSLCVMKTFQSMIYWTSRLGCIVNA